MGGWLLTKKRFPAKRYFLAVDQTVESFPDAPGVMRPAGGMKHRNRGGVRVFEHPACR